jgi:formyltetrahydrofolate synthetase
MELFNLHLTGDLHAITAANNLIAAAVDTRWFHESTIKNDDKLFDLLCPLNKNGKRIFVKNMFPRLEKLGIKETDPEKLTKEERVSFSRLNINPEKIIWNRVVDCNDRMLREIEIGKGNEEKNRTRITKYDITVASELMAILALSKDVFYFFLKFQ